MMDCRYVARAVRKWYSSVCPARRTAAVGIADLGELLEDADDPDALWESLRQHMDEDGNVTIPVEFKVCRTCDGTGRHVNPDVDSHGICQDEWDEMGHEGQEAYLSGAYDVTCYECGGDRVVPEPADEKNLTGPQKDLLKLISERQEADVNYAAECAMERMMGC